MNLIQLSGFDPIPPACPTREQDAADWLGQFADVSGPRVIWPGRAQDSAFHGLLQLLVLLTYNSCEDMAYQLAELSSGFMQALPQRWDLDHVRTETVKEIFAKEFATQQVLQRLIGRRDNPASKPH